jgi:hypothetical protein
MRFDGSDSGIAPLGHRADHDSALVADDDNAAADVNGGTITFTSI